MTVTQSPQGHEEEEEEEEKKRNFYLDGFILIYIDNKIILSDTSATLRLLTVVG